MELAVAVRIASEFTGRAPLLVAPHLLHKLAQCRYELNADLPELTRLIRIDPALCFQVLHLDRCIKRTAPPTDPVCIDTAVTRIGITGIDAIITNILAHQVLNEAHHQRGRALAWLWKQALATAVLAHELAAATAACSAEEAYIAGLLHNIGKLVLLARTPTTCAPMLTDSAQAACLLDAEEQVVGATQNRIGAYLIRRFTHAWFAADAARFHTAPENQIGQSLPLVQVVWSARRLALDPGEDSSSRQAAAALLDVDPDRLDRMVQAAAEQVQTVTEELGPALDESTSSPSPTDHPEPLVQIAQTRTALSSVYQGLLHAGDRNAIVRVLRRCLCVYLGVEALMIFDHNPHDGCLVGRSAAGIDPPQAIRRLQIPLSASDCLPVLCHAGRSMVDSFSRVEQNRLTIIDRQLLAIMGTDGLVGLPLHSSPHDGCLLVGIDGSDWPWDRQRQTLLASLAFAVGEAWDKSSGRDDQTARSPDDPLDPIAPRTRRIVHEINNPLNIITNYLKVVARRIDQQQPVGDHIRIIDEEIRRVGDLVRSLTMPVEKMGDDRKNIDVNATIKDIVSLFREGLPGDRNVRFEQDLDPGIPLVAADRNLLKQALVNLLKNATEAMPDGGTIAVRTRMLLAMTRYADGPTESQAVKISVCDDGPGIDEGLQNTLFNPHVTTKAGHDGLGLTVVKEAVGHLNGALQCESGAGRGACFHIEIPAVQGYT